ncbi:hypothetical protein EB093_09450 [bacterium]|nr:hypothetical protein [bacterium]
MGIPTCLRGRYPLFEQRWELRDQFAEILDLMSRIECGLRSLENNNELAGVLLREIEEFRVWSWREPDRDSYFYDEIRGFYERACKILDNI